MLKNLSYVIPGEVGGVAYPSNGAPDLAELLARGFHSLVAVGRAPPIGAPIDLNVFHYELPDFDLIPFDQMQIVISAIQSLQRPIAVCCGEGIGRTGTVLACYLVTLGRTAEAAIAEVRAYRPQSIDHHLLELSVYEFWSATSHDH